MSELSRLYPQFFEMYMIQELDKIEIKTKLNITESMYTNLVKEVKKREITEINTTTLETLCCAKLNKDPNDDTALKMAMEIWKFKHKIPNDIKTQDTGLESLLARLPTNSEPV